MSNHRITTNECSSATRALSTTSIEVDLMSDCLSSAAAIVSASTPGIFRLPVEKSHSSRRIKPVIFSPPAYPI